MILEVDGYVRILEQIRGDTLRELENMPEPALNWVPLSQDTNSPYALVTHMCGAETHWIQNVVGDKNVNRDRDAEFATKGSNIATLREMLGRTSKATNITLGNLSLENLSETKDTGPGRGIIDLRWAILHVIEHLAMHLGHIQITKQLYNQEHPQ